MDNTNQDKIFYFKEYWFGDSKDGKLINGEGLHYFKMQPYGFIVSAYEYYEEDDGSEVVTHLPEMENVDWIKDLGFENTDTLEEITEAEFNRIKELSIKS